MRKKLFLAALLVIAYTGLAAGSTYYYGDDGPIVLMESDSLVTIKLNPEYQFDDWSLLAADFEDLEDTIKPVAGWLGYDVYFLKDNVIFDSLLDTLNSHYMVYEALAVYNTLGGVALTNNQLVTKFPDSVWQSTRDSLIDFYHLEVISISPASITVLRTTLNFEFSAIETANLLYESGLTLYAHPDLVVPGFLDFMPNDPYFQYQYYLDNTEHPIIDIDAPTAWEITKGDSQVIVAVIDDGIQDIH